MAPAKRKTWNKEAMKNAVEAVREKKMGYLKASKEYGVPKGTLERYVKDERSADELLEIRLDRRQTLGPVLEKELSEYSLQMADRFHGLRCSDIRHMAFQLGLKNGLPHPFNTSKEEAGQKWLRGFLKRNPTLSLRTPEGLSLARAKGFCKESVNAFFDVYEPVLPKINHAPCRIFNVDETGLTIVQNKKSKIVALKGKKQINALTSAERGKLVTVVTCMNAQGTYIPPLIVFPRKNMSLPLMDGAPPGSIWACHKSGWIQTDMFTMWFEHFLKITKPTEADPVILVLDGHYSHTRNLDVIELARQNHVFIVVLPPHCTHRMQPLDIGFMLPLKTYYAREIETYLRNNPGKVVTPSMIMSLFTPAYNKAATMEISINSFRKTGLFPCNRYVFDAEFGISEFNPPSPPQNTPHEEQEAGGEIPLESVSSPASPVLPASISGCSTSTLTGSMVLPADISPVPQRLSSSSSSSRSGSAVLITSSPYKRMLEEKEQVKRQKLKKKLDLERKTEKKSKQTQAKTKAKTKTKQRRILVESSDEETCDDEEPPLMDTDDDVDYDDDDVECMFCSSKFSEDTHGEKWSKCRHCHRWSHEDCGEIKDSVFLCNFCSDI